MGDEHVRDFHMKLGYPNGYPVRETPPFPKQFGSDLSDVNAASRLHRGPATTTIGGFTRDRFHHSPPRTTELEPLGYPNGYPRFCFIHTFVDMACDLCQRWAAYENVLWGSLYFLRT